MSKEQKYIISVYVEKELKERLQNEAKHNKVSMSSYIRNLLTQYIEFLDTE